MVEVNYAAIAVSTVFSIVWGSLWYGPFFGKTWTKMMDWTKGDMEKGMADKAGMVKSYSIQLVGSLIMVFVLSHSLVYAKTYLGLTGVGVGLQTGFWNWLGFVAPATLGSVLWEGKPWKLWLIYNGYFLTFLLAASVILSVWA